MSPEIDERPLTGDALKDIFQMHYTRVWAQIERYSPLSGRPGRILYLSIGRYDFISVLCSSPEKSILILNGPNRSVKLQRHLSRDDSKPKSLPLTVKNITVLKQEMVRGFSGENFLAFQELQRITE